MGRSEKEYIAAKYKDKDIAKKYGARYDSENCCWYIPPFISEENREELLSRFELLSSSQAAQAKSSPCNINHQNDAEKNIHNVEANISQHSDESGNKRNDIADVKTHHHIDENNAPADASINSDKINANHYVEDFSHQVCDDSFNTTQRDSVRKNNHNVDETKNQDIDNNLNQLSDENVTNENHQPNNITTDKKENNVLPVDDYSGSNNLMDVQTQTSKICLEEKWNTVLENNTLNIIYMIKKSGLPKDKIMRGRLFRRLNQFRDGDYPITYDGLKIYYPELLNEYPVEIIKEKIRSIVCGGDYKKNIEVSDLPPDEKGLLLFILP